LAQQLTLADFKTFSRISPIEVRDAPSPSFLPTPGLCTQAHLSSTFSLRMAYSVLPPKLGQAQGIREEPLSHDSLVQRGITDHCPPHHRMNCRRRWPSLLSLANASLTYRSVPFTVSGELVGDDADCDRRRGEGPRQDYLQVHQRRQGMPPMAR
jgi:hypothetical protein